MANEDQSITAEQALDQITRDPDLGRGDGVQPPAAPAQPPTSPAGQPSQPVAQPPTAQPRPLGGRYVPAAALEGERGRREQLEQERDRLKTAATLYGFKVGDDGTITPPPTQQQPYYQPQPPAAQPPQQPQPIPGPDLTPFRELAAKLGITPEELAVGMGPAIGTVAAQMVAPILGNQMEQSLRAKMNIAAVTDAQFPVYQATLERYINAVDGPTRYRIANDPQAFEMAVNAARAAHLDTLVQQRAEHLANPGTVVGRFTERASPGTGAALGTGTSPTLPPEVDAYATKWGLTPEQKAHVAERRARRKE